MEDKARQFVALDMAKPVTDAKTQTDSWIGSMSGVAAQAERVLNTLQALSGLKINISAPKVSTPSLPNATPVAAPAGGDLFDRLTDVQDVSYQPDATKPAASMTTGELQAVVTASLTRAGALETERSAADQLAQSMADRLASLKAETLTLQTLAAGTFATEEAARLYAEATVTGTGAIDQQTAAMIQQIDAAAKLNGELQRLATDPVRAWMGSVPTWVEAGQKIESEALGSLSEAIAGLATTGRMDFEALGDSIANTAARVVADMAVKELVGLFGGNTGTTGAGGFGLGQVFGAMFGAFDVGGLSTAPANFTSAPVAAFRHAPHFAQGTANTSGIPAVLHPNEAVIPLSKGRKIPVEMGEAGGTIINAPQTFHITTPDADSFRRSKKQIAADMAVAGARAVRQNG